MKTFLTSFVNAAVLATVLSAPMAVVPALHAQDHKVYHDKARNDDHEWNDHENQAYRIWVKDNHRKNKDFAKLKPEEQEQYWAWRHDHSDALLKIDIN